MSKYSNYRKAVGLTPTVARYYWEMMSLIPSLSSLSGSQLAAVALLMYKQKLYGFDEACRELDLI